MRESSPLMTRPRALTNSTPSPRDPSYPRGERWIRKEEEEEEEVGVL
jgi:hypothetical protein